MKTVNLVIGSVEQVHTEKQFLRYFSLLPATATTLTAVPTVEATAATIGHQGLTVPAPTPSTSAAAVSVCTAPTVRTVSLSAASRNNKSLR